jgi:stalled ribosome rescue protein Dom34
MKTISKPVGIWLDSREAIIVYLDNGTEKIFRLHSEIDETHPVGGSGSSTPYSAQEAVSETRYLHRRQQQEKQYYQSISEKISKRDAIYIMGPSQAKIGLEQELKKQSQQAENIVAVESCDRITDNQIRAKIRDFFKEDQ